MSKKSKGGAKVARVPLMYAFQDAFEKKDARKVEDVREKGERVISKRGSFGRFGVNDRQMRNALSDHLVDLVNTINLSSIEPMEDLPRVSKSILNFGLPDVTHMTSEDMQVDEVAENLRKALIAFEPRLNAEALAITRGRMDDMGERISFSVQAEMLARPINLAVEFTADVDIHSGKVHVSNLAAD